MRTVYQMLDGTSRTIRRCRCEKTLGIDRPKEESIHRRGILAPVYRLDQGGKHVKYGIGIIGAGGIAQAHAEAYRAQGNAEIKALADTDAARAQASARSWGVDAYGRYEQLLERKDIHAVSICTPPASHAEIAIAAAAAGKHVLVEKPVSMSLGEADEMIAAAKRAEVILMVGHTHRFWPANVKAKELIEGGEIGEIIMASDDVLSEFRVSNGNVPWRLVKSISGGGVVMDNGVHAVDRLSWWLGKPLESVYARTSTNLDPIDVENNCEAILNYAGGAYAQLRLSFTTPPAAGRCRAEFLGTRGALFVETWGGLRIARHGEESKPVEYGGQGGLVAEIADFLAAIEQGRPPKVTGEDGRAALETVLAIYRSSATGQVVKLPLTS